MSKELAIIETIGRIVGNPESLANDAFWDPENRLIYTTDMLVEEQHFKRAWSPAYDLGWKSAAVNISDIAGMGGKLKYLLVSLALPDGTAMNWIEEFYQGLNACAKRFGGKIVGGDTVAAHKVIINVTAIGELPPGHHIGRRDQAQPGDYIITTGPHGLSGVGLELLKHFDERFGASKQAHLRPEPRIEEGLTLSRMFERYALMDSSDGLADALLKIAQASGVRLVVEEGKIPVAREVSEYGRTHHKNAWDYILYGGEDFELVATVPEISDALMSRFQVIGRVEAADPGESGAWLARDSGLEKLEFGKTFQHFSG